MPAKRFRMTIGRRIGLGYGLFIFFAAVVVWLTNSTIERSRRINDQINYVYGPSVDALTQLRSLIVNSRTLIKHWAMVESIPDAPEKVALLELRNQQLPAVVDRIDTLQALWDRDEVAAMSRAFHDMSQLFALHDSVKNMLATFESYKDPEVYFQAQDLAEEGSTIDDHTDRVLADLDALLSKQSRKREALREDMIKSLGSLRFMVLYLGSTLVVIGALIAVLLVRGIVRPVHNLRAILLKLGRGVFPQTPIIPNNDEIGDMSKALVDLVDGLKRTTDFSHALAAGDFKAEYQPLSSEDVLGHALLRMRTELGERERILEEKVRERTEEMVRQKDEIERQSKMVMELYTDVTDSIRYAKRLQESMLPPDEQVRRLLPGGFVFFRPKDIVSGDFYWVDRVNGKTVFAAVDCTGHGVPGAFMSLVGHNGLNQIVSAKGVTSPAQVLELMNRMAVETLHKDRDEYVRDGMDMAFCTYDPETMILEFAGANNPLYLVRNKEVIKYEANRRTIGSMDTREKEFSGHSIQLQHRDSAYIFSDGFADQFGGPRGKKFLYKRFRKLLVSVADLSPKEKREALNRAFNDWKSTQEQIDDVLVMGIQV